MARAIVRVTVGALVAAGAATVVAISTDPAATAGAFTFTWVDRAR